MLTPNPLSEALISASRATPAKPPPNFSARIVREALLTTRQPFITVPHMLPTKPPTPSFPPSVERDTLSAVQRLMCGEVYPVGISLPTSTTFFSKSVTRSPSPRPGIMFNMVSRAVTSPPRIVLKPEYRVSPSVYPTKPPLPTISVFWESNIVPFSKSVSTVVTVKASASQSSTAASARILPAKAPVAKSVGSFSLTPRRLVSISCVL